jgi:tetratricopeptide (TPR) repeat protein
MQLLKETLLSFRGQKGTRALLLIFLAALAIRIFYLREIAGAPEFSHPAVDARFHDLWARDIAGLESGPSEVGRHEGLFDGPFLRPPGYPYFLALVYALTGGSYLALRLVQMALGLAGLLLAFLIGRRWFGRTEGLLCAAGMASYWLLVYFEGELHAPPLMIVLVLSSLYVLGRWTESPSFSRALAAGFLLGAGALVWPNVLLFPPLALAWMIWQESRSRRMIGRIIPRSSALILGVLLGIAPATLYNTLVTGEFVLVSANDGINLYIGNNEIADGFPKAELPEGLGRFDTLADYPDIKERIEEKEGRRLSYAETSSWFTARAARFVKEHPVDFLRLLGKKALLFWGPAEISNNREVAIDRERSRVLHLLPLDFPLLLTFAALGTFLLFRTGKGDVMGDAPGAVLRREIALLLVLFVAAWFASYLPFFVCARYRAPMIPALMLLAACGAAGFLRIVRRRDMRRAIPLAAGGVALYLLASWNSFDYEPRLPTWYMDRGRAYRLAGDSPASIRAFQAAVDLEPWWGKAHFELANALEASGETARARAHYEEAARLWPGEPRVHNNLGILLARQHEYDAAIDSFQRALARDPGSEQAHYNIARAYEEKGERGEAALHYREAVALKPDFAEALRALERLGLEGAGNAE